MASTDVFEHFEELPDPRMDGQKRHALMDILFIAICTVICGGTSFVDMYDFGCAKEEWFRKHLELANGIPSHDTFRRVFSIIDADAFRRCLMNWTKATSEATDGDTIAFDGKTLRRSFDTATGLSAIHVVNAWSSENDFCVGQMKVDGKSNEIMRISLESDRPFRFCPTDDLGFVRPAISDWRPVISLCRPA